MERGDLLLGACWNPRLESLVEGEAEPQNVLFELVVGYPSIKVLIHLSHELEHLLLCDHESHALQSLVEFVYLDELVLVDIDLIKHLFESEAFLLEHLQKVIEDVVLRDHPLLLHFELLHSLLVVHSVVLVEFPVFDDSVTVRINFLEECCNFVLLKSEVEMTTQTDLEVLKREEADSRIQTCEGLAHCLCLLDSLLDCPQHAQSLQLLLEACCNSSAIGS